MTFRQTDTPPVAAAKASISAATAYRFEQDRRLPSHKETVRNGGNRVRVTLDWHAMPFTIHDGSAAYLQTGFAQCP